MRPKESGHDREKRPVSSFLLQKNTFYRKLSRDALLYHKSKGSRGGDVLRAIVYPEPYNFENTPEEDKTHADFPFTEEGLDSACNWLNEQYESRRDYWQHVPTY